MVRGSTYNQYYLKERLISEGYLVNICSECGQLPYWNGKPLKLQLDHIDGDNKINLLSNLRLLCPNCHTQTKTYSGRNVRKLKHCCICNIRVSKHNKSGYCKECSSKMQRRVNRPDKEELIALISDNSYVKIGRMFGVSDNAIRKWARQYKIIE